MGMDLVLRAVRRSRDESIGSFVRRGWRRALEKLAEPIMAGIYVASADELAPVRFGSRRWSGSTAA